jgi:hypothetical protein
MSPRTAAPKGARIAVRSRGGLGPEAAEGLAAFVRKRAPRWVE